MRRAHQTPPGRLVVDHEQIAVRAEDVTQPEVEARQLRRRVQLYEGRCEQPARKVVADASAEEARREIALRQSHAVGCVSQINQQAPVRTQRQSRLRLRSSAGVEGAPLLARREYDPARLIAGKGDARAVETVCALRDDDSGPEFKWFGQHIRYIFHRPEE